MNILISNDDGIFAPGLVALAMAVRDLGDVTVVAPDSPQSAMAHSITLRKPLAVQYVHLPGPDGLEGVAVAGRPADCVRLAVRNLMPVRPDLVLSGINAGANVGANVFYSGTVAAAAEAAMCGIPAVAFSADMDDINDDRADFVAIAKYCRCVLDNLLARADSTPIGNDPRELISVNIPTLSAGEPLGCRVCEQSDAEVDDQYIRDVSPEGIERYRLGELFDFNDPHIESDVALLRERYITVTPLRINLTAHEKLDSLKHCHHDNPAKGCA